MHGKSLYAFSYTAFRGKDVILKVGFTRADTEEEASADSLRTVVSGFPEKDGWEGHRSTAQRIGEAEKVWPYFDPREDPEKERLIYPIGNPNGFPIVVKYESFGKA
jgi:hypothetical protein